MAEATTIARPYAEAMFRLADEANALDVWAQSLDTMAGVAANPDVQAVIANPSVTGAHLVELFLSLCKDVSGDAARNLVKLLVDNGRLGVLPQVRDQFAALKEEREGIVEANIASAFPLDEAQQSALIADLERKFRRKVRATISVDQELIGGVRIAVGDEVIDASVRGKLANLAIALKR